MSELIDLTLRALLNDGDEVLVPSPDYPLWTAAVTLNRGRAVHYPCRPEQGFVPDPAEIARLITPRTRALVVINPNNPTGAVYPRAVLEALARLAERTAWCVFSDEIYDQMTYDGAEFVPDGDAGARHAVRDAFGAVQGLPCLRLPRRLGGVLRPRARRRGLPRGARAARRRCACVRNVRRSGRCRRRSADTRASASSSRRAAGCTSRAR